jgi:hypothetical protein
MKLTTVAFTVVLFACVSQAQIKNDECRPGYENQTWDQDSYGYCTQIPDLRERAERAEAFLRNNQRKIEGIISILSLGKPLSKDFSDWLKFDLFSKSISINMDALEACDTSQPNGLKPGPYPPRLQEVSHKLTEYTVKISASLKKK